MQNNNVAILIDGGFFFRRFKNLHGKNPTVQDVATTVQQIVADVQKKSGKNCIDHLFRTYFYDCPPYDKAQKSFDGTQIIDFSKGNVFREKSKFLKKLKTVDQVAIRLGQITFTGWKIDPFKPKNTPPVPDFRQKGVDMKIGLDIAWIAGKKIVDKIVLVTGDSDFISPMKLARREGILIYLYTMKQQKIKIELKEHADFIL